MTHTDEHTCSQIGARELLVCLACGFAHGQDDDVYLHMAGISAQKQLCKSVRCSEHWYASWHPELTACLLATHTHTWSAASCICAASALSVAADCVAVTACPNCRVPGAFLLAGWLFAGVVELLTVAVVAADDRGIRGFPAAPLTLPVLLLARLAAAS